MEKLLEYMKWLCFLTCCGLCIWKIADSFVTFYEREVGTKIELKLNHETDLPGFAVCRHPNQILRMVDDNGISLDLIFDLKLSEVRYLKAFEKAESLGTSVLDIYKLFLYNNSQSVKDLKLSSRGQYAGTSTPSLVSDPYNEDEWSSFWHPLYGVCFAFKTNKPLVEIVGSAGVEYVKVDLNFESAFPALPTESLEQQPETTTPTTTTTTEYIPDTTTEEDNAEITETQDDSNSTTPEDDEPIFGKKNLVSTLKHI